MNRVLTSLYRGMYSVAPGVLRRALASAEYRLERRIREYRDPLWHGSAGLRRGAVTVSLDFEMAWAWMFSRNSGLDAVAKGLQERENVPLLLRMFDDTGVPATWATVGHLFLSACSRGRSGKAHEAMHRLRPFTTERWAFPSGDWFQHDPCSDVRRDPAWYAPDLIEKVMEAKAGHEIACHGFSHAGFGPYCPPEVAASELSACRDAMRPFGLTPATFVFPRHDEGNFPTLAAEGIRIVRTFPVPGVHVTLPVKRADGMWAAHSTSALDRGRYWTREQRLARLLAFVDAAVRTRFSVHIWLHPSLPQEDLQDVLFPLLRYCAECRDRGELDTLTMEQLVRATEAAHQ